MLLLSENTPVMDTVRKSHLASYTYFAILWFNGTFLRQFWKAEKYCGTMNGSRYRLSVCDNQIICCTHNGKLSHQKVFVSTAFLVEIQCFVQNACLKRVPSEQKNKEDQVYILHWIHLSPKVFVLLSRGLVVVWFELSVQALHHLHFFSLRTLPNQLRKFSSVFTKAESGGSHTDDANETETFRIVLSFRIAALPAF